MDMMDYFVALCIFGLATSGFITLFGVVRLSRRLRRVETHKIVAE